MIRARFSPKAERDLDQIRSRIASANPEAAERVWKVILHTADFLAQHPELGHRILKAAPRHQKIRWFPVPQFRNYLLFYQQSKESIIVVRVLHAARDWTRFFPPSNAK